MTERRPMVARTIKTTTDDRGRRWARCAGDGCDRTLGRIVAGELEVKEGRRVIWVPWVRGLRLPCPRCHVENLTEGLEDFREPPAAPAAPE